MIIGFAKILLKEKLKVDKFIRKQELLKSKIQIFSASYFSNFYVVRVKT
ncbi:hypothetical protein U952_02589 [Staphylococcus aureus 87807-12]|nr:hypothetical protein U952_02589 [Staphylococcus aureus 87807-12]